MADINQLNDEDEDSEVEVEPEDQEYLDTEAEDTPATVEGEASPKESSVVANPDIVQKEEKAEEPSESRSVFDSGSDSKNLARTLIASKQKKDHAHLERTEAAGDKITSRFNVFKKKKKKVRGKIADPTKLPILLSLVGKKYVGVLWEAFIVTLSLLYFFGFTFQLSFAVTSSIHTVNRVFDYIELMFLVDLALRLLFEAWRHARDEDSTFFFIPFSTSFWVFHMTALFPFEYIFIAYLTFTQQDSITFLTVHDYCHFGRLMLTYRVYYFYWTQTPFFMVYMTYGICASVSTIGFKTTDLIATIINVLLFTDKNEDYLERDRVVTDFMVFILRFFTTYFILTHAVACFLVWSTGTSSFDHLLSRSLDKLDNTWLGHAYNTRPDFVSTPIDHYLLSVVFGVTMLTSVGYGNPAARNEGEMLICVTVMLIGAIGLSGIFGSYLTSFLLEQDGSRFDLFYRLQAIQRVLKSLGSTCIFSSTVTEYYECLWNFREGVYHVQLINYIPQSLHRDIVYDICTEMFDKAILFRGLEEPFLRAVSRAVELVLYNPDMIICQQGDYAMTMYYIIQGECLVKSKHNNNITTAILRAGCIFGESDLFLSYPHSSNVETLTTCQLLRLSKEHLMEVFNDHIYILGFMRSRVQERLRDLQVYYEKKGQHPISWIQMQRQFDPSAWATYTDYDIILRWAHGYNNLVDEDIVNDTEATVIVDMPCRPGSQPKDKMIAYKTCVIPPTLNCSAAWVYWWHVFVMLLASFYCFVGPYNIAFKKTTEFQYYTFTIFFPIEYVMSVVFVLDLIVELATACPVSGIYYKFRDGLTIKINTIPFYLDILSALPLGLISIILENSGSMGTTALNLLIITNTVLKCTKMWKVARYFTYLGNIYYQQIFWFRVVQALIIVFICVHWMACIAFSMACTPADFLTDSARACRETSWLSSLYVEHLLETNSPDETLSPNNLANKMGYLVSMYFSISTFSTSGYGDFIPRNRLEMAITILYVTMGFYLTGYFTGLLTSALACTTRPNVFFQQTLVSIRQFLTIHGLSGALRDRIIEHYRLQHQYNEGVVLPKNVNDIMYDAPPYLAEDCLYATLHLHLAGIPIFDHITPNKIIQMAKMMERYVLPPNIFFLRRGDVRRQMYIIYKGSVAFLKEQSDEIKLILEETGHFGQRDLLFGEPSHNNIKTLSYCVIYAIDLQSYNIVFARDLELQAIVKTKKNDYADRIRHLNNLYASVGKLYHDKERKPTRIPSWIVFPKPTKQRPEPFNDFCDCEEFQLPYKGAWGCFLKLILMRRTVHPAGTFALCWKLMLGFLSLVIIIKDFLQIIVFFWAAEVDTFGTVVNFVFFVDMYVSMHWGYYTDSNHLVCHPVKTATHYILDGGLVYAFFVELAPYPVILVILRAIGYSFHGDGRLWSAKISFLGKLIRIFRVPIIIRFCHRVFVARTIVLMSLYVIFTVFICTCVANFAIHLACPWYPNSWKPGDDTRLPACTSGSWITNKLKNENINHFSARWIVAMYYVCQVTFIVGYGDMASLHLNETEIYLSLALMIFGFIVMRVIISDITAAAVDSDEIRASFAEQIECLQTVLTREKVHPKLIRSTIQHMKHTWLLSKGLEPQQLLGDLHPALQSDLFSEYIGDAVSRVPIFSGMRDNILRTICTYMKKQYFKRGERIMRRGNLEYEMYIIVDGDVWIAEKNLELRCSLGPGESMGETQMIYGLQRRYSAVAANNVEVFALNSQGFSQILDRYPNLLEDIEKKLYYTKQDLFERKISLMENSLNEMDTGKRSHFDAVVLRNSAILRDVVYAREVPGFGEEDDEAVIEAKNFLVAFITRHVVSYGTENHGLPFIYFASRTVMKRFSLLLHPRCGFQQFLQILVLAVAILSPAMSIFHIFCAPKVATHGYLTFIKIITWIFETIYVAFMLTRFITPFATVEGEYCTQHKRIAFRYLLNFTRFPCDLISTIPLESFEETLLYTPYRFLNAIRMLRLIHYYRSHNDRRGSITETAFRYNLIMSVSSFALMVHLLACIFYGISECDPSKVTSSGQIVSNVVCKEGTWTAKYIDSFLTGNTKTVENLHTYKWYIRALYWVICTVSTTGFGDITPLTLGEIGFALFCIFCGAFVLSIILSLFTSGIASNAKFYREYTYQVKLLVKYLSTIGLTTERQELVQIWFNSYWQVCRGCSYRKTTQVLPLSLEIEVNLAIYYETIKLVPLFNGLDKRFLRQVAHRLIHYVHLPGSDIRNEGDQGDTLYIVAKGRVAGYVTNSNGHAKLIRWYSRGKCFGRLPALFYGQTYTKSYRAEVRSEILYLRQKDIYQLAQNFPQFALKLQDHIEDAYNPVLGTSTILTEETKTRKQIQVRVKKNNRITKKDRGTSPADHYKKRKKIIAKPKKNRGRPQRRIRKLPISKSQQREEDAKLEKHVKDLLDAHVKLRMGQGLPASTTDGDESAGTQKKKKKKHLKFLQKLRGEKK